MQKLTDSPLEGGGRERIYFDRSESQLVRRLDVEHAEGEQIRQHQRDAVDAGGYALGEWTGEAFTFTVAELAVFKKIRPDLFEYGDPVARRQRWIDFGNGSVGKYFRVR